MKKFVVVFHIIILSSGKRDKIIAPKIQRLITPTVIARRKALLRYIIHECS